MDELAKLRVPKKNVNKPLRIPIEAVYCIGRVGTVVCGRVETGSGFMNKLVSISPGHPLNQELGREVQMVPQTIHEDVDATKRRELYVYAGQIVGINLKGISRQEIKRGQVLSDPQNDPCRKAQRFIA